jgi:selenocysteine lyase/cysteine desulfurase
VLERIDAQTAICSVETCHWTDGGLLDLVSVAERARAVGAALVVDGTQSIGALPFAMDAVRPDFLISALYKWMLGPYGAAAMWCAPPYREGRPLESSWITRRGSGDFAHLVDYQRDLRPGARRYDVGQTSSFAMIPAIGAALDQILGWGVENICVYASKLTALVAERASELDLHVEPAHLRAPHLIGVHLSGTDPEAVAASLADSNVHVSVRGQAMRVSPHVYNDERDIDRLFQALRAAF